MAVETKIARVAFTDKGAYSEATEYSKWDFVTTADSTYLYIGESPAIGKPVTDTAYWKCIADGKQATLAAAAAAQAAGTANDAASLADQARLAIETELGEKAAHGYDVEETPKTLKEVDDSVSQLAGEVEGTIEMPIAHALSQLKEEVDSLRMLIEEGRINKLQIETLDVISEIRINGSPLIYVCDSAPSFSPDQVPQFYIDTSAGRLYTAKGAGSANDWF